MATIDIGKIKPVFKGTYDNSTAYVLDDIVYYNGSSYVAKTSTTGNLPTDTTKWNVLASGSGGIWDSTLSLGSAGQVVKVNSGGNALEFGAGATSDFVKLQSGGSNTPVSELIFDNLDVSTYTAFKFIWNGVPSADGNHFRMNIRTGGASGSTYTSTKYYSGQLMVTGGSGSISTRVDLSQDYWEVCANAGNGSHEGHRAIIWFYPRKSTHEDWHGNTFHAIADRVDESNNFRHITSSGRIMLSSGTQPTMTGFKLYNTGGNIKQYDYELYGIK